MPTEAAPHGPFDVFLSYARADNHPADARLGWVTALQDFIQSAARLPGGIAPWVFFDTRDINDYEDCHGGTWSMSRAPKFSMLAR